MTEVCAVFSATNVTNHAKTHNWEIISHYCHEQNWKKKQYILSYHNSPNVFFTSLFGIIWLKDGKNYKH